MILPTLPRGPVILPPTIPASAIVATYSYDQLKALWIANGGSPATAGMAAAIAIAESGGRSEAVSKANRNGTQDWGLWQINKGGAAMLDANANAKQAISMSKNGATWRPWCTAYGDNACGTKGGSYLGKSASFWKYLSGGAGPPGNAPMQDSGTSATTATATPVPVESDNPCYLKLPVVGCVLHRSQARALMGGLLLAGGVVVAFGGVALLVGATGPKALVGKTLSNFPDRDDRLAKRVEADPGPTKVPVVAQDVDSGGRRLDPAF